jgi:Flp pilus assembly protein TadD
MGEKLINPDFVDLRMRAELLELCGDLESATRLREQSFEIAREVDLTCYAYQLMWRHRIADAIDMLERNAASHPQSWNIYDSLGEAYEQAGERARAVASYRKALRFVRDERERQRIERRLSALA